MLQASIVYDEARRKDVAGEGPERRLWGDGIGI
jgi:hypothetical protein